MPFLDDLLTVLEADNVGTLGVDISLSTLSAPIYLASGATLHLAETGGAAPDYTQNAIIPSYVRPTAQLMVRSASADDGRRMAEKAFYSVIQIRNQTVNGSWYRSVRPLQSQPADLGVDDRGQIRFSFNVIGDFNRRESL